ncbi:MAG: NAD-dependent epimerase/dehydratase family protein [Alphaproteobacteria bacterium]|nr:NAD-dependent epimerase/dehydratase family protein [Alphaproteobacteria bacterium]
MRVFVTGAAGFIGSAVVPDLIQAGHEVVGLARSDANVAALKKMGAGVHHGSLEDPDSLRAGADNSDGVIHLAFIHDFSKFAENGQIEKRAIEAMGEALAGSNRPMVVTSGVAMLAPGRVSTEEDVGASGGPRVSEAVALAFADRGVRVTAVRLPQVHGGEGKAGFIGYFLDVARQKGVSAYVGDGANRMAAAHRLDVAPVYRLALEKGVAGARYHAVGDEGVPFREIAEILGRAAGVPTESIPAEKAAEHFGWLGMFAAVDAPASNALTQQRLGWKPTHAGLIADIGQPGYFRKV